MVSVGGGGIVGRLWDGVIVRGWNGMMMVV